MKKCDKCDIAIPNGTLCQTCRKYQRNGGVWHTPPKYGTVAYDEDGKPICHICGMACDKLIEHTKRKHGLDGEEYRKEFGLMVTVRLVSPKYSEKMKEHALEYKTFNNNFQSAWSGETRCMNSRGGKHWSKQEIEQRRPEQAWKGALSKSKISPERMEEVKIIWAKNLPKKKEEEQELTK